MDDRKILEEKAISFNRGEAVFGLLFILAGLVMPSFVHERNMNVTLHFREALKGDQMQLLMASLLLVIMNAIRAIPHYMGIYWVVDSIRFPDRLLLRTFKKAVLVLAGLLSIYYLIEHVRGIHYDFGIPAMLMVVTILSFDLSHYDYVSRGKRSTFIMLILIGVQFLDVMPLASRIGLPVGRGELSVNMKLAAEVLEMDTVLDVVAGFCFLSCIGMGFFVLFMIRDENRLREMVRLREQNEKIRMEANEAEIQNRLYREMQYVVHDMRSPLSVVQTLVSALRMQSEAEGETDKREIYDRMEHSLDLLREMSSQLLSSKQKGHYLCSDILKAVMAQISTEEYASCVKLDPLEREGTLLINGNLMNRALVNLIQNSVKEIPEDRVADIRLGAHFYDGEIGLYVSDNGRGIEPERQKEIWEYGNSGKASYGYGLAFVKSVVENMDGRIAMTSSAEGTMIELIIPLEET